MTTENDIPPQIGPYRLEKRLGEGGMGEIYRAWDERLARWVAVKHIRPEAAANARIRARFRREARAAAALNHPAIVQIYDVVLDDRRGDWIVMELVEGTNLSQLIQEGPLAQEPLMLLLRQIADGLSAAHDKNIVHRDLKPENVMVAAGGQTKILDFGVAKRFGSDVSEVTISIEGSLLGTARAMSPEQALGHQLDGRSDLFSLGSLAYEALTGRSPFLAATPVETLTRICTYEQPSVHELAPAIDPELSTLVDRLLAKEPARRPQSAAQVVVALDVMLGTGSGIIPLSPEIVAAAQRARHADGDGPATLASEPTPQEGARRRGATAGEPLPASDGTTQVMLETPTPLPPTSQAVTPVDGSVIDAMVDDDDNEPEARAGDRRWLPFALGAAVLLIAAVVMAFLGVL